ncbi:hypothetical protein STAFG_2600 [Streptomyces afghaniensis 772]|uniref:Uncharacterized protein n=1 Tax=Streptomyces afghaniensis 772 TaxID=1283301 RepID=S4MUG8_9ACTN|nr:hypothetical protein STAFG_2600 [Streptomyces afghaniensis 772]
MVTDGAADAHVFHARAARISRPGRKVAAVDTVGAGTSITQDAPTSASRSGRPGSGLPDFRAAGLAGEIGDDPLAGLSSVSTTGT